MVNSERTILGVLLLACVLGVAGVDTFAREFAGFAVAVAEPATGEETLRSLPETFLVYDNTTLAFLGTDGHEIERFEPFAGYGAFSRDGRWLAFNELDPTSPPDQPKTKLVIRSRVRPQERTTIPLVWGTTGSSFQPIWASDSKQMLICEQGPSHDGIRRSAYRVYDLTKQSSTELKLPEDWWPSDWSPDGKRLLQSRRKRGTTRIEWVNIDGSGEPEFITSEHENAYGARLSPDGRRILCMIGPKPHAGETSRESLHVIDLTTKKKTAIGKPGHTHGFCWSSDGSKIAYTWQMPLRKPEEANEGKTYLITCDADGSHSKTVTIRRYAVPQTSSGRDRLIIFFRVVDWWR
jgi:Tol biopolymer transport system component